MLAKVQYPGPDGGTRQFDAQVPDEPPMRHTFRHPDNGTPLEAELVNRQDTLQPGGGVAIYRAVQPDES
jgi:hypothetical protein